MTILKKKVNFNACTKCVKCFYIMDRIHNGITAENFLSLNLLYFPLFYVLSD